jgi:hypothetical protein
VARPAGLEPATSWFVGRSEEATGGSARPLPPVLLGFSTPEATPGSLEPLPIVSHLSVRFAPQGRSRSLRVEQRETSPRRDSDRRPAAYSNLGRTPQLLLAGGLTATSAHGWNITWSATRSIASCNWHDCFQAAWYLQPAPTSRQTGRRARRCRSLSSPGITASSAQRAGDRAAPTASTRHDRMRQIGRPRRSRSSQKQSGRDRS